jgi:hypothetical protein
MVMVKAYLEGKCDDKFEHTCPGILLEISCKATARIDNPADIQTGYL